MPKKFIQLVNLFFFFFKISLFTIGGGYVMALILEKALLKKRWIAEEEFRIIFNTAQAIPGSIIINVSFLTGKKLYGILGAFVAAFGTLSPPFITIIAAVSIATKIQNISLVASFFKGAYAASVGLITYMLYRSSRSISWTMLKLVLILIATTVSYFFSQATLPLFCLVIIICYFFDNHGKNRKKTILSDENQTEALVKEETC